MIGCGLSQEGIGPPTNQIFFPGAIRVGPSVADPTDSRWLFVANRQTGSASVIDTLDPDQHP